MQADVYACVSAELLSGVSDSAVTPPVMMIASGALSELRYLAHRSAEEIMRGVAESYRRYEIHAAPAVHRIGGLKLVALRSCLGHPDAFAASRTIIDDIRHAVPIWTASEFKPGAPLAEVARRN